MGVFWVPSLYLKDSYWRRLKTYLYLVILDRIVSKLRMHLSKYEWKQRDWCSYEILKSCNCSYSTSFKFYLSISLQKLIFVCFLILCFSWRKDRLDNGQVENLALWWERRCYTGQSLMWRNSSKVKLLGIVILSTYTWACWVIYLRRRNSTVKEFFSKVRNMTQWRNST